LILFGAEGWVRGGWVEAVRAILLILAVFVCVVLHEFGHSLQVRRYGIPVKDVVLLPIGGMARAFRIPENPWHEIVVALSGPLVNFALALVLYLIIRIRGQPMVLEGDLLTDLFAINVVLGTFNLIPAYPMDGGRILRGLLALRYPYLRATRYAKNVGQLIALTFVVVGFVDTTFIMLPMIAVFVYYGAMSEERVIQVRFALRGKRVREFVTPSEPVLSVTDTVDRAVEVFARSAPPMLLVADETKQVLRVVNANDVEIALRRGAGADPLSTVTLHGLPLLDADMSAVQAYHYLKAEKRQAAGVIDQGAVVGLLYVDSLLKTVR
jgi:Zn-dependent protease